MSWTATLDKAEKRADGLSVVATVTFINGADAKTVQYSMGDPASLPRLVFDQVRQLNLIDAYVPAPGPVDLSAFDPVPPPDPTPDQLLSQAKVRAFGVLQQLQQAQTLGLTVDADLLKAATDTAQAAQNAATDQLAAQQADAQATLDTATAAKGGAVSPSPMVDPPIA